MTIRGRETHPEADLLRDNALKYNVGRGDKDVNSWHVPHQSGECKTC